MTTDFTKNFTRVLLEEKYGPVTSISNWREDGIFVDLINHMETKFEELEGKIKRTQEYSSDRWRDLCEWKGELNHKLASQESLYFKAGYVYKDRKGCSILIGTINPTKSYPLMGIDLTSKKCVTYTWDGRIMINDRDDDPDTLLLSTEKPWKPTD